MKKIVVILLCLLCALCASANPMYRGFAQAPVTRMNSTSSMMRSTTSRTATSSQYQVRGIQTYASNVTGGVTSGTTYSHIGAQRRLGAPSPGGGGMTPPSDPTGGCQCEWVWDGTQWVCVHCGSTMTLQDGLNGNFHDPCPCPISFDWTAILFLLTLTCAYVTYKETKKSRA